MTHTLTVTLRTPANTPLANVVVEIRPVRDVAPTAQGLVVGLASATTDAQGEATFDLLPSPAGSYYYMTATSDGLNIGPERFQMPAQNSSLNEILNSEQAGTVTPSTMTATSAIGRLIASSDNLPTTRTALQAVGTYFRFPTIQLSVGVDMPEYTISGNTITVTQPLPSNLTGWWIRAVRLGTEICRIFLHLNTIVTASAEMFPRVVRSQTQTYMGVDEIVPNPPINYFLLSDSTTGTQNSPRLQTGSVRHSFTVEIVTGRGGQLRILPANTRIEVREAIA